MKTRFLLPILATAFVGVSHFSFAHDAGHEHLHAEVTEVYAMPHQPEETGPVNTRRPQDGQTALSGQGFWTFAAVSGVLPIPEEAAKHVGGAHGTIIVDGEKDLVYWGLANVGWIAYSNHLSKGAIIAGDPVFARGNLHGAELYSRSGKAPLVAVADNVSGEVYLSDTSFEQAKVLDWPADGPYAAKGEFHPTDVTFVSENAIYVTDGYGKAYFLRAGADPLAYQGPFIGGKEMSNTPHGITYRKEEDTLVLSARPEGEVKRMKVRDQQWLETLGLPAGSTVCDIEIWGDYALAPCLKGPDGIPGPIYILNLKARTIVSVIKPKEELGFSQAEHIHDAAWYFSGDGPERDVYIVFTNWNPGGIGALKLVNAKGQ